MEIESFYKDDDMSFGMDGRITFSDDAQFIRADGGGRAAEVANWYKTSNDCSELEGVIIRAKADVKNNLDKIANPKTKKGEKRVLNDYTELIKKRIVTLEEAYRKLGCVAKRKQAEEGAFIETLKGLANPADAKPDESQKPKATTYVIAAVGALVLGALTIFVIKKMRA
jgi:hypothetical protein